MKSLPHNLGNPTISGNSTVTLASKKEYLSEIKERYLLSSRQEKKQILDEFCSTCQYNRKYAIRLLNAPSKKRKPVKCPQRGRPRRYDTPAVLDVLLKIWEASNLVCSKRLTAMLPLWMPWFERSFQTELDEHTQSLLAQISAATIDRLLKPYRAKYGRIGLATTKPGSLLKKRIPIRTNQWDETRPGFIEVDTVAHCGTSVAGQFVYTVNAVDIATGWTVQRAVWGKGETGVLKAIQSLEESLPFSLRGFDSDNGNEFLNHHLEKYLTNRKRPVEFTRSREYEKNDNAHVEGKNWTHVRQYLGYRRFDLPEYVPLMNDLYTSEWTLLLNFFLPSVKLIEKRRVGATTTKRHDAPQTPLQRVLHAKQIPRSLKTQLQKQFESLNPFSLHQAVKNKIKIIHHLRPTTLTETLEPHLSKQTISLTHTIAL